MIGAAHHLPGVAIVADVPSPGQGLEGNAKAPSRRALAKLAEVGRRTVDAAKRVGRHIAADHQEIAAQFGHQVELALGAGEGFRAQRFRHPLKVAKGLERDRRKAEVLDPASDLRRGAIEGQQVVLEDLDPLEAGGGNRFELFIERAAQANGGDGSLQRCRSSSGVQLPEP